MIWRKLLKPQYLKRRCGSDAPVTSGHDCRNAKLTKRSDRVRELALIFK